jgi:hypothetical protein
MHTLHWIAVEADNAEEAFSKVNDTLLYTEGDKWWDWFDDELGGRWAGNDWCKIYQGKEIAIGLEKVKANRKAEVEQALSHIDLSEFEYQLNGYEGEDIVTNDYSMNLWRIKKVAGLLSGDWNCDSYFYDMEYSDGVMAEVLKRIESDPDKQFLVPIDFHF